MSPLEPGHHLAHYRIESRLGAGGMGEVYKALDTKLARPVAIKVLAGSSDADPNARRRLLEEARSAAALTHPHIVTIYSVDSAEGADFIVMEFVAGRSLQERLGDGPLDVPALLRLGIETADALAAAHAINLIHRDIKPGNILLTTEGAAKVLDFGIAKRTQVAGEAGSATMTHLTGAGMILGTAAYMAPEQARGEELDGRSDVFSLGATLYEAATGRRAFEGETALDTMVAVATKDPPHASVVRPEIPSELDAIFARALAKRRDDRYGSARELADALRALRAVGDALSRQTGALRTVLTDVPHNLPNALTSFVGRSRERGEVRRLLTANRLVTVLGPGGSGKTRLAIQVAKEMLGEFPDGAWLAELEAIADPAHVAPQVARALGVLEGPSAPTAAIAAWLAPKSLLLVLDNCEHVVGAVAPLVAAILQGAPGVRVVATSREALGVGGEVSWRIPTLSVPDPRSSAARTKESAGRFEAIRLFVDRGQAAQPTFTLTDKNAPTIAQICHRLDGIPLAIELAAVRVKVLPVDQILSRLQDRFALLTGGNRTALPRQQTLRAAVAWSYDLLSDRERKLLNRLSVFAGGFTLESSEAVCGWNGLDSFEVLDLLSPLVDKSLVVPSGTEETARYTMLETIREYAAERLHDTGERSAQSERHAAHYHHLALEAEPELQGPDQATWFARLDQEHDNLRRALRSIHARADGPSTLRFARALWRFWYTRGYWEEGRAALRDAIALAGSSADPRERAQALYGSAVLARVQGDFAAGEAALRESLAIARGSGDEGLAGTILSEQGNFANERGEYDGAVMLYREALQVRRSIGDKRGISLTLHNLAVAEQSRGDSRTARAMFEEALVLHRELGDPRKEASTLSGLSDLLLQGGDLDGARATIERGLAIQRELGDKGGLAFSLRQLGEIATQQGNVARARACLAEGLEAYRDMADRHGLVDIVDAIAGLAALQGPPERALMLKGAGSAWRHASLVPRTEPDLETLDRAIAAAREALGDGAARAAETRGEGLPPEEALRLAQEVVDEGDSTG